MKEDTKGLTVRKAEDMPEWYTQVVRKAKLADHSPIKGCMVIRPLGLDLWEGIRSFLDERLKEDGVRNAYFPLFIPESFFQREAEHAEGFTPEVAWVENKDEGERYAIRPTSETVMYDSYGKWIRSWRDLPLRINQWCNIVRWEVQDVKLFLRSREFLWQEGHCVYETEEECHGETLNYLERYRQVAEELLAIPVMLGEKSARERFPGARRTYAIEGFMPDGKALQMGTSHDLSQGFAKAFNISFQGRDEKPALPWQNSWGISTRMVGALVLTHGDDKGLVLPPRVAPHKVAVVPIIFEKGKEAVLAEAGKLGGELSAFSPVVDTREEYSAGWKFSEYELQGVPVRVELGPKDLEKGEVVLVRRDTGAKESVARADAPTRITALLEEIQRNLFSTAKARVDGATVEAASASAFEGAIKEGKLVLCNHCGSEECELALKEATAATARCIPLDDRATATGACVKCGKDGKYRAYFARAY